MENLLNALELKYIVLGLGIALILAFLLIIILLVKVSGLKKKYRAFLRGSNGKSLETTILDKFDKMEEIVSNQEVIAGEMKRLEQQQLQCFSKMKVYKYNAFKEMGGETSFVIGLLDKNNNGTLLNGMTSRNATYVYAKEIENGKAKVALSKEELITLEDCIKQ